MFFSFPEDFKERELAPGIVLRLVWGEHVMLSYATFQPNSTVPAHSYPHEQTGIIVEGELELTIGNESRVCRKGDAFTIPGNIEHSAASGDTATTVIDTFSPPREDYM
jgi:quercetin dioxygenase-like cupin family protein